LSIDIQPFPKHGDLAKNLDMPITKFIRRIGGLKSGVSYVLSSVGLNRDTQLFEQRGSAPNFQGGCLTLCTCKHQMRSSLDAARWKDQWVAGFTGRRIYEGRHWLFFLTRVAIAQESHADLWNELPDEVRNMKSAHEHYLGDLFKPRGDVSGTSRFGPRHYFAPSRHAHRRNSCDSGWQNDINYRHAKRYGHPSLLVGDPSLTFLWERPTIYYDGHHCRNFLKWNGITEFCCHLRYV
jgi:hypothetical protein